MLSAPQVAAYLGRSDSWFLEHRRELEAVGFPGPVAPLGLWDLRAIDRWVDQKSGLQGGAELPAEAYDADWEGACRE